MPDLTTRAGYDLQMQEDDQGPPHDLCEFIRDDDAKEETRIYCSQSEADDFERYMADGEPPLLDSDTLSEAVFSKLAGWLEMNVEGGIHAFDYWTKLDDYDGFASHLKQRYQEAKRRQEEAEKERKHEDCVMREQIKMLALQQIAELYQIKL